MDDQIDKNAKIIWEYMLMHQPLKKADCIFVLGSSNVRVAEYASELFLKRYAPFIILSGGIGARKTGHRLPKAEAEVFADIAVAKGVPKDKIVIENAATNTGDNIRYTKKLLSELRLEFQSFILVQKPYMERRTCTAFRAFWSEKECIVTSPQILYEEYPVISNVSKEHLINMLVGDLQRIKEYPKKGWQIPQEIPDDVWQAYEYLVERGYTQQLINR